MTTQPTPTRGAAAIAELRGVSQRYGQVRALEAVDFRLEAGEVVALLGPNGAGKTTLVHLLLGLLKPQRGHVRLFGLEPSDLDARRRSGAMLQLSGVPENLTVAEHLACFAAYYPRPRPIAEVMARTGLGGLDRRPYGKLSGGQRQRLHLALALIGDPEAVFLDEPTTGLDVTAKRGLWDVVRGLAAEGRAVLLTTHDLNEAETLADRVVLLHQGRTIASGTPAEVSAITAGRRVRVVSELGAEVLGALPGVRSVHRDGAAWELLCTQAEPVVLQVLQLDPRASELEVGGVRLEEAFLALTGQTPPDERAEEETAS